MSKMEKQELLNAIATLSGSVDSLSRAGETDAVREVVTKILELIKKLD